MTPANMARYRNDANMAFREDLEEGYDAFDLSRQQPRGAACGRRYAFNQQARNPAARLELLGPCPELEAATDSQHIAHHESEVAQTCDLLASGAIGVPLACIDRGMNPVFRKTLPAFGPERLAKQATFDAVEVSRPSAELADPYALQPAKNP